MPSGLRASALLLFAAACSELALLASRPRGRIGLWTLLLCLLAVALEAGLCAIVFREASREGDRVAGRTAKAAFLLSLLAGGALAAAALRGTISP